MGVYEDLLRRKKIIEDENGNVTVNAVVDKKIRDNLNNNNIQTYTKSNLKSSMNTFYKQTKKSLWNDILGIAKNIGTGGKIGIEQMLKKTELDIENSNSSYKNRLQNQFLSSNKISDTVKAEVKNNSILTNKIKTNTNLPTISNIIGETNKEEQERLEKKVEKETNQYRNSEGKIETNLTKQRLQNAIDEDNKKIAETTENMSNNVTKYIASNLAPSIGQMGTGAIMSSINPAYGALYFTQSAGGSYYDDAKQRGMNDNEALKYGTTMGAVEGATELIGLKQFSKAGKTIKTLIKGTGKEVLEEGLEQTSKATLKSALKDYGIGIADNIMQESIIEPIQELTSQVVAGKDKANWDNIGQRMLQSGINGGLVSAIVGGSNLGIQSCTAIVEKAKNGQKITDQEFKQAVNDASKELDVSKMIVDNTQQQINKYKTDIENNQETLYNNSNGTESDLSERNNGQVIGRNDETTRIYEKSESQQTREYSWEEYNKWEQSIKPIETNKLTDGEKKSVEYAKVEYNKDVILYDENENNNTYSGGASKETKGKITISKQSAEEFGLNRIIDHENLESDILHDENTRDILSDVIEMIQKDENFRLQKEEFWKGQEGNIPTDYLIAKDIICDRFSEIKQKEKLDYNNVLSNATKSTIDNALINYYYQVYGKELDISSSFNLPTKQNTIKLPQKETNVEKYNIYKQNILKGRAEEVNNLIKNKNETINEIEKQIKEKTQLLNNKKDKTTKVANNLKMQIKNLKQRKSKIENEYNSRIDRKFDKVTKDKINLETKKELGITRKEIQQNLLEC